MEDWGRGEEGGSEGRKEGGSEGRKEGGSEGRKEGGRRREGILQEYGNIIPLNFAVIFSKT